MKGFLKKLMTPLRDMVQFLIIPNSVKDYNTIAPYKHNLVLLYEERLMESSVDYAVKNFRRGMYFHFVHEIWELNWQYNMSVEDIIDVLLKEEIDNYNK